MSRKNKRTREKHAAKRARRQNKKFSEKHSGHKSKNQHHLTPKDRGGTRCPSNLLDINIDKHFYWHQIFKNQTLEEVIELLIRLKRMKHR